MARASGGLVSNGLLFLIALSCGGETKSKFAATGGAGGAGGSGSAGLGGLEFKVLDQEAQPISGAIVVANAPDGSEEQTSTDANGIATFNDVSFAGGTLDVTAFSPGFVLVTVMDVTAMAAREIYLSPPDLEPATTKKIAVKLTNKVEIDDTVLISSTARGPIVQTVSDSVELELPDDATGKILALDYANWLAKTLKAAVAADVPSASSSIEIDFSKSATVEHSSGSIHAPESGKLCVAVTSRDSFFALRAGQSPLIFATEGPASWQLDFFRPLPESEILTMYSLALGYRYSDVYQPGYPSSGPPPLPEAPSFVNASESPSVFAPIEWKAGGDRPDSLSIYVPVAEYDYTSGWQIWFSAQRDTVTLRRPPPAIWNALEWTVAAKTVVILEYCDPAVQCGGGPCAPSKQVTCARAASALNQDFTLDPP